MSFVRSRMHSGPVFFNVPTYNFRCNYRFRLTNCCFITPAINRSSVYVIPLSRKVFIMIKVHIKFTILAIRFNTKQGGFQPVFRFYILIEIKFSF